MGDDVSSRGVGCRALRGNNSYRYIRDGAVRSVTGANTGDKASRITGVWLSSTSGAGKNGGARLFSVEGTVICAQGASGGVKGTSGGLC